MPSCCSSNKPYLSLQLVLTFYVSLDDWIWIKPYMNNIALLSATFNRRTEDEVLFTHICFFHYHECTVHTKGGKKNNKNTKRNKTSTQHLHVLPLYPSIQFFLLELGILLMKQSFQTFRCLLGQTHQVKQSSESTFPYAMSIVVQIGMQRTEKS